MVASDTSADKCSVSSWVILSSRCCPLASASYCVEAPRIQKYRTTITATTKSPTTVAVSELGSGGTTTVVGSGLRSCTQLRFGPVAVTPGTRLSRATARCMFRAAGYWTLPDRVACTARRAERVGRQLGPPIAVQASTHRTSSLHSTTDSIKPSRSSRSFAHGVSADRAKYRGRPPIGGAALGPSVGDADVTGGRAVAILPSPRAAPPAPSSLSSPPRVEAG